MDRGEESDLSEPSLFGDIEPIPEPLPEGTWASVAPEVPVRGSFTYLVPPPLRDRVQVGVRVLVPFGGRAVRGFVVDLPDQPPQIAARKVRALTEVIDAEPVLAPEILRLARWAADYYHASVGETLAAAVPKSVGSPPRGRDPNAWVTQVDAPSGRLGKVQQQVVDALADGPRPLAEVRALGGNASVLRRLEALRLIEISARPRPTTAATPPTLTGEQQLALSPLLKQVERGESCTTLLFGITGSGKTEVYLRAIARVLELGRSAIVLVPEIALTPQTLDRFRARFGETVAILHSQLSGYDRRSEWWRIHTGEARVVIGPRSAIWAPVRNLGLIVVDEEHEATYKQESNPRYHARDLAVVRGSQANAPVILGSATPSLESFRNAQRGRYRLSRLRQRPGTSTLPEVRIVDMGREYAEVKAAPLLSRILMRQIENALKRGERALLFQNRRGFTTYLQCKACGFVLKCSSCDISLTYHRHEACCVCHFCDERRPPPSGSCPDCNGPALTQRGAGTERVVDVVQQLFPTAHVGRLDTDVVRGGETAEQVLERFRTGEIDILVGTQIIAKGLDIPEVTVVGVISADTSLSLPDFRSSERTFQLIAQVAGRAGRGERPGFTCVQTFLPDQFAIRAAAEHRYEPFAAEELATRRALDYPPFARLLKILLRGPDEGRVRDAAGALAKHLRETTKGHAIVLGVLGPAPCPRAYLAKKHRWQLMIKGTVKGLRWVRLEIVENFKIPPGVERVMDVDPFHLL